jgi:cell division protein FtsI (penicillin-binding protein 3)
VPRQPSRPRSAPPPRLTPAGARLRARFARPTGQLGDPHRRLSLGLVMLLVGLAAVGVRLVQIQTFDGRAWAASATDQRLREEILAAPRGAILDRNAATLAQTVQAATIFADPTFVKDPAGTAAALTKLLGVPEAVLEAKMAKKVNAEGRAIRFVYLARRLDPEVGQAVAKLELAGINQEQEERRDVPGRDLAANVIGFTGSDGNGLGGIEARYDDVLAGKDGTHSYEVGGGGAAIPGGVDHTVAAQPGSDVQLTIDRDLSFEAQRILEAQMKRVKGLTGTAVVQDAKTGEVLAMASYPTFDASDVATSSAESRLDLATGAVVEPGSVHKAITIGAGLETGVIEPGTVLPVSPTITKGGTTFRDTHQHKGTVGMTLQGILAQSSNVGTIEVADKVGPQRLYEFQKKFGLGQRTDVGLPGESAGIVQPPSNWSGPSYGGVPIGLGVAVTPLQMASAYQAIANDGVRIAPRVVRGTTAPDGKFAAAGAAPRTRVMSAANAAALRQMLEAVPSSEGTAPAAAIDGYRVAGKTGTGQRVQGSRYLPGNVASFVGMAPADKPRFVIAVFVHAPAGVGGAIAGPAFHDLMSFTLRHFDVPPTGTKAPAIRVYG